MSYSKLLFCIPLCLILNACASISEVKKEDRDLGNSFDGDWIATLQKTEQFQKYSSWSFTCEQITIPISLRIANSSVQVILNNAYTTPLKEAYISSTGDFKASLPTGFKGKTGLHSDINLTDVETRFIVEGNLSPAGHGSGNFIIGWAPSRYNGCKTELFFVKE